MEYYAAVKKDVTEECLMMGEGVVARIMPPTMSTSYSPEPVKMLPSIAQGTLQVGLS